MSLIKSIQSLFRRSTDGGVKGVTIQGYNSDGKVYASTGWAHYMPSEQQAFEASGVVQTAATKAAMLFQEPGLYVYQLDTETGEYVKSEDQSAVGLLEDIATRQKITFRSVLGEMFKARLIDGNAYLELTFDAAYDVADFAFRQPWQVKPKGVENAEEELDGYWITSFNRARRYIEDPAEVVHWRQGSHPRTRLRGISPLKANIMSVVADTQADTYTEAILRSPTPGLIIGLNFPENAPADMQAAAVREVEAKITEKFRLGGAGGAMVTNTNNTVSPVSFSPQDLSIDLARNGFEERICAAIGIPPILAGFQQSGAKYDNFEQTRRMATETFLVPAWVECAQVLTRQLGFFLDLEEGQVLGFDLSEVRALQEDEQKKAARFGDLYQRGVLKRSEARAALGYDYDTEDEIYSDDHEITEFGSKAAQRSRAARALLEHINGGPLLAPDQSHRAPFAD